MHYRKDRGSAITNGRLDISIEGLGDALELGVRDLKAKAWM